MALKGDLRTLPLRDLLGWLAARRASGTLSLSRGMMARRFHLRGGRVMLSSSTDAEMLLGHLLVKRGLIETAQLETVLRARQGSRLRLGAALTRAGLVSAAQLRAVLTEKVRRLLVDALKWSDGGFFFDDDGPLPKRAGVAAVVRLAEILALPLEQDDGATDSHLDDVADVSITDEDIIEIIELTRLHPPTPASGRSKRRRGVAKPAALAGCAPSGAVSVQK